MTNSAKIIQGYACLYDVQHWYWKNERFEVFQKGCFNGSLSSVWLARDHKYTERSIADQDTGSLAILDTEIGLAFRAKLKPSDLEWIDGRSEVSVGYVSNDVEVRNGVHVVKSATLIELSLCHVATERRTHAIVCDAHTVGTLADDARSRFASDGAATKFLAALNRLDDNHGPFARSA